MEAESFSLHPYRFEGQWSAADKKFVAEVLVDPRGWAKQGRLCVPNDVAPDAPVEFTMRIASEEDIASMFPEGFRGLSVSVMNTRPREIYFNAKNWAAVPPASGYRSLKGYRTYLVNHEVGHAAFGLGHRNNRTANVKGVLPAPVMMQQTLGTGDYVPNPWPVM